MIFRVDIRSSLGVIELVNTLHVRTGADDVWTTPDPDEPGNVADAVNTQLQATYRGMLGITWTLDTIAVSSVPDPRIPGDVVYAGEHPLGVPGARETNDEDLPATLCGRITWRTAVSGKSFRGRTFCPPIEDRADIESDILKPTGQYYLALVAFADDVVDANSGSGFDVAGGGGDGKFGVYSRTRHNLSRVPFFSDITSAVARSDLSLMHSRAS